MSDFSKMPDFYHKRQSLQPAWLRESGEAVDADRVFIWGKAPRQPHINGSGERPTFHPVQGEEVSLVVGLLSWALFRPVLTIPVLTSAIDLIPRERFLPRQYTGAVKTVRSNVSFSYVPKTLISRCFSLPNLAKTQFTRS